MNPVLTLDSVSMQYDLGKNNRHSALSGISLQVRPGDRLGIIGRNGSGKSTLLKIMAKIFPPTAGYVEWAPEVTASLLTLGLGFRPDLSGRDNAYLSCLLMGLTSKASRLCVSDIEAFCELGRFFDEPVRFYSVGMRARLGFASALMNQSQVLLIDEVLSVGDELFKQKAKKALEEQLSSSRAVILVSHNSEQIRQIVEKAILIDQGRIAAFGDKEDVLATYQNSTSG